MNKKDNEIISLNDKLFNEFSVEELEARLETDPLLFTTMFAGMTDDVVLGCDCKKIVCPGLECGCDGKGIEPPFCPIQCACQGLECVWNGKLL